VYSINGKRVVTILSNRDGSGQGGPGASAT